MSYYRFPYSMNRPNPESKVHEANMGPIWGRQGPGGPHVGPMNFAILEVFDPDIESKVAEKGHRKN